MGLMLLGDDGVDVIGTKEQEVLAVNLDLVAAKLAVVNLVANLDIDGDALTLVVQLASTNSDDLATLRLLKSLGVEDITADWSLAAFNSQALAELSAAGVRRFVASPENSRQNLSALAESGYAVEFLSQQSTPLFISLTKPEAEPDSLGESLTYFRRDGLWVTTRTEPRTFDVPSGASSRIDLSWDPVAP